MSSSNRVEVVPPPLLFAGRPEVVAGVDYVHRATGERLRVGSVSGPAACRWCGGSGALPARPGSCHVCRGTGAARGSVICWRPRRERSRRLPLIWDYDEFEAAFERADCFGATGRLF